ncbi:MULTISPECIES: hypothetical protein [unclassified Pseudomonas]|uniref:hypothetical protein n=1 Tax=unclassified Pseudomonas TaxID=196821 RepID=UPI000A1F9718|nr:MULTISPECIES: hypothetical protein [unclassified Pseudomonas]
MNDKMREEFETAARAQGLPLARTHQPLRFANGHSREAGDYIALETLCAFWAWQASREALVIVLPPAPNEPEDPEDAIDDSHLDAFHAAIRMRSDCQQSIESAGLKVTP